MQTLEIIQAIISGLILALALGVYDCIKKQCCKKEQKEFIRNKIIDEIKKIFPEGGYTNYDTNVNTSLTYKRFIRGMNIVALHRSDCIKSEELYQIIEIFQDAKESSFFSEKSEESDPVFIKKLYAATYKDVFKELENIKWLKIEKD